MVDQHVTPNVVTFNVIIDEFCKNGKIDKANELLELMMKRGVSPTAVTYDTLIYGFCLMGRIDDVRELFVSMINKGCRHDVFSYNITINGYCKNHKLEEAMSPYRDMISEGIMPDAMTYGEEKYSVTFLAKLFIVNDMQFQSNITEGYCYYAIMDPENSDRPPVHSIGLGVDRRFSSLRSELVGRGYAAVRCLQEVHHLEVFIYRIAIMETEEENIIKTKKHSFHTVTHSYKGKKFYGDTVGEIGMGSDQGVGSEGVIVRDVAFEGDMVEHIHSYFDILWSRRSSSELNYL
ncbi:hypothetical protein Dsin_016517 [Dipteronia sinensis]|uniref:Pentatricopeptide repeat-containing protein n=1 Tax=Dipteronia sinensis TaxID=43782 RepID=A0AAE0AD99_9ROSI|nr:hypothetical protein Dsin_016517 [Dipteronia sinensis]